MKKKLGPLPTWQWLAIGAAIGLAYYIYKSRQATSASSTGTTTPAATPATDLGPIDPTTGAPYASGGGGIDPTTGIPYALELAGSNTAPNQNSGPTSLAQELGDLQSIEALMAGLPVDTSGVGTGAPTTLDITIKQQVTKAKSKAHGVAKKVVQPKKKTTTHPHGHAVTTHPGGKKTVASTAPQNSRQHQNVQPPSHQRANPTVHHTASKPPKPPARPRAHR